MNNNSSNKSVFHNDLKRYMDGLVNLIYDLTLAFPKDELYGVTSQIRRAGLSIVLNYIEGYARRKKNIEHIDKFSRNFLWLTKRSKIPLVLFP